MRVWKSIAIAVCVIAGTLLLWVQPDEPCPLLIEPMQRHLGKIGQFDTKPFEFILRNTGKSPLKIVAVSKSCGCTEAAVRDETIPPGGETVLSGALAAQDRVGEFGSVIAVTARDSKGRQVMAQVQAGGKAVALLHGPANADLGEAFLGDAIPVAELVYKRGEDDAEWDELRLSGASLLRCSLEPTGDTAEPGWRLKAEAPVATEAGAYRESLELELWRTTDGTPALQGKYPVTAYWRVKPRHFTVTPTSAYLGVVRPGEVKTARLRVAALEGNGPLDLEASRIEVPEGLPVRAGFVREGEKIFIEVRTQVEAPCGVSPSGHMRVELSGQGVREACRVGVVGVYKKEDS